MRSRFDFFNDLFHGVFVFGCVDDQYKSVFQVPMVPILSITDMWVWWSLGGDFDMIPFEK